MLNQVIEVGRVCSELKPKKSKSGKTYVVLELEVPRNFKNKEGVYDTDYIECTLWDNIAENTAEYLKVGDIVGVKGRLSRLTKESSLEFVSEKVTFLSSKSKRGA